MTEKQALKILKFEKYKEEVNYSYEDVLMALEMSIKAMQEIQMYNQGGLCLVPTDVYKKQCDELDRFKEICTIEEVSDMAKKNKPKKVKYENYCGFSDPICPSCERYIEARDKYCKHCGQKIEWS